MGRLGPSDIRKEANAKCDLGLFGLSYNHNQRGSVNGSGFFEITRGVKQGDVLSSLLFNSGLEHAVRRFKDRVRGSGIDVGGARMIDEYTVRR